MRRSRYSHGSGPCCVYGVPPTRPLHRARRDLRKQGSETARRTRCMATFPCSWPRPKCWPWPRALPCAQGRRSILPSRSAQHRIRSGSLAKPISIHPTPSGPRPPGFSSHASTSVLGRRSACAGQRGLLDDEMQRSREPRPDVSQAPGPVSPRTRVYSTHGCREPPTSPLRLSLRWFAVERPLVEKGKRPLGERFCAHSRKFAWVPIGKTDVLLQVSQLANPCAVVSSSQLASLQPCEAACAPACIAARARACGLA
jgi:hypothetical protein